MVKKPWNRENEGLVLRLLEKSKTQVEASHCFHSPSFLIYIHIRTFIIKTKDFDTKFGLYVCHYITYSIMLCYVIYDSWDFPSQLIYIEYKVKRLWFQKKN